MASVRGPKPPQPKNKKVCLLTSIAKSSRRIQNRNAHIYYVVIGGRFAPPYKYIVKYMKQKQQQEQQFQSFLPPELDTLTLHEGGLPNIKGGLPLFRPLE